LDLAPPEPSIGKKEALGRREQAGQAGVVDVVGSLERCEVLANTCEVFVRLARLVTDRESRGVGVINRQCQKHAHCESAKISTLVFPPSLTAQRTEGQCAVDPLLRVVIFVFTFRWLTP